MSTSFGFAPEGETRVCFRCGQPDPLMWYCGAHGHCAKCSLETCNKGLLTSEESKAERDWCIVEECVHSAVPLNVKAIESLARIHIPFVSVQRLEAENARLREERDEWRKSHESLEAANLNQSERIEGMQIILGTLEAAIGEALQKHEVSPGVKRLGVTVEVEAILRNALASPWRESVRKRDGK